MSIGFLLENYLHIDEGLASFIFVEPFSRASAKTIEVELGFLKNLKGARGN